MPLGMRKARLAQDLGDYFFAYIIGCVSLGGTLGVKFAEGKHAEGEPLGNFSANITILSIGCYNY